jgi:phosphate butyryltransferase
VAAVASTEPSRFCTFDDLLRAVAPLPRLRVAVVGAADPGVLDGMVEASELGIIDPVLVGETAGIAASASTVPGASHFDVVDAEGESAQAEVGVELVESGRVAGLVKGRVHTEQFLRPVVSRLRSNGRISHVFVLDLASYPRLLTVTDAAINISPDLAAKRAITQNAIDLVHSFGIDRPKVAVLSAVELVNPSIPSTIDAACLAKMSDRGQIKGADVDGPLAMDLAISADSASIKRVDSPVAGAADVLVVPDIDAGNILVKDLEHLGGATLAGIVLGATAPVVLTSRADPPRARLLSCALAAWHVHGDNTATR